MKRLALFLITVFSFISCSNNGDKYLGTWDSGYNTIYIVKQGAERYAIKYESFPFTTFCIYDNGCFIDTQVEGVRKVIACDENGALNFQNQLYQKK